MPFLTLGELAVGQVFYTPDERSARVTRITSSPRNPELINIYYVLIEEHTNGCRSGNRHLTLVEIP